MTQSRNDINDVAIVTSRLKTLPIYPIFQNCNEKYNLTALQFMCILDFYADRDIKLYEKINKVQQPKLLGQLLQFRSFEKFKYIHYSLPKEYGNSLLECKYCHLVGPTACILTHMTISHNVHTGLKACVFCKKETHIGNSLRNCYKNYIQNIDIDKKVSGIVSNFYGMLKGISENLNICTTRRKGYAGRGYKCIERLPRDYGGDIAQECEVRYFVPKNQLNRSIRSEALSREFWKVMDIACGGNWGNFAINRSPVGPVIEIDDTSDNDEEVNNLTESGEESTGNQNLRSLPDMIISTMVKCEPRFSDAVTPSTSSYTNSMTSTPAIDCIPDRLSTYTSVSRQCSDWTPKNKSEKFAFKIARKLQKFPLTKRRYLEIGIKKMFLDAEKEAIEKDCHWFAEDDGEIMSTNDDNQFSDH